MIGGKVEGMPSVLNMIRAIPLDPKLLIDQPIMWEAWTCKYAYIYPTITL